MARDISKGCPGESIAPISAGWRAGSSTKRGSSLEMEKKN